MFLQGMGFIAVMYLFYGIGGVIMTAQVPERWKPGAFDLLAHSHQIWHCFILVAAMSQYKALLSLYHFNGARGVPFT